MQRVLAFVTRNPKRPDIDSERQLTAAMREGFSFSSAPGTRFEYSNLGYALLGQIVQRVSGKNLRDYVNAEILLPLGMNSTYWQAADAPPHAEPAPSAALVAARDGVTQLLQQWDDALVQRTFDPTCANYPWYAHLREDLAKMTRDHGRCGEAGALHVYGGLHGSWRLSCERGAVEFDVGLSPALTPLLSRVWWKEGCLPTRD
jgi:CubicO group peptidase (beta-lactamase class C family)